MPFLQEKRFVFDDRDFDAPHFDGMNTIDARQSHRRKPEFALAVRGSDVNVRRLLALIGIEVEAPVQQT